MRDKLAINGGDPVRHTMLPYGRQDINQADIQSVVDVLKTDWLTTGPKVSEFESEFANVVGATEAVSVSSGTAALHASMHALNVGIGDEVILPAITFAATANCILYQGGTPVFADVDSTTLLLDINKLESKINSNTKAIVAVDYAGHPCDYDALRNLADQHNIALVADACHSLGGMFGERSVGSLADINAFSFHPVKAITCGEGGMITMADKLLAEKIRTFRNHGITTDHHHRSTKGEFHYDMAGLGFNYRLTDVQSALGINQIKRLSEFTKCRRAIAAQYNSMFEEHAVIDTLNVDSRVFHPYHLYVVKLRLENLKVDRDNIFAALRAENIGVNVHYLPVYLHSYYRALGYRLGSCPVAEKVYEQILSLPIFSTMTREDVEDVVAACNKVFSAYIK